MTITYQTDINLVTTLPDYLFYLNRYENTQTI